MSHATPQRRRRDRGVDAEAHLSPSGNGKLATNGHDDDAPEWGQRDVKGERTMQQELPNMFLLVLLYMMQGVPLGLTSGSMPFLLQANASYTQIGIFSIASYPYSFKLLWSPIVDSIYSAAFGRRKSWVVPIQLASAVVMLSSAAWAEDALQRADIVSVTAVFFVLVLLAATQDIAVDGWALTLLSRKHVGYASTCQTIGMNIGYFLSFTGFLALNDASFSNRYLRKDASDRGVLQLGPYLRFWAWMYILITLAIALFKREGSRAGDDRGNGLEDGAEEEEEVGVREAYAQLWGVIRLPAVQQLGLVLLTYRLFMLPAESAAALKLLEKGVAKEALAGLVLIEFPCELVSAVLAGRWAATASPVKPWMVGFRIRLVMAAVVTTIVLYFPAGASSLGQHPGAFAALAVTGLVTSFSATLMFTALGSFFNRISDPAMGGAYLTLLNTIANMGYTMPKVLLFWLMDALTGRTCHGPSGPDAALALLLCPSGRGQALAENLCTAAGGTCVLTRDGFYVLSYCALAVGILSTVIFGRVLPRLEALPLDAWRAKVRTE